MKKGTSNGTFEFIETGEATALLPAGGTGNGEDGGTGGPSPILVIGTGSIRNTLDESCLRQAVNARRAPGVTKLVLNPDAHGGYGVPIGTVLVSPTHVYPGPVGVDIRCSMSLLQLDLPASCLDDAAACRELVKAVCERVPAGTGGTRRAARKAPGIDPGLAVAALIHGAAPEICTSLGIPADWAERCEEPCLAGSDGTVARLEKRLDSLFSGRKGRNRLHDRLEQLGTLGGGNHFGEAQSVKVVDAEAARAFGLEHGKLAFMTHCGSRRFGYDLAEAHLKSLRRKFERWGTPFPGGDRMLVYAPLDTPEADDYLDDLALAGNFATVNHLLINKLVLDAFKQVFPGCSGRLVYLIGHNFASFEHIGGRRVLVHRKGATRALPAGHPALRDSPFEHTGHPILLPGNPAAGSVVMKALPGAGLTAFSINHGAGRAMGRKEAFRRLRQSDVDRALLERGILSNHSSYPLDEAPAAYKDFDEVLRSVELAGLASVVARLEARMVIK